MRSKLIRAAFVVLATHYAGTASAQFVPPILDIPDYQTEQLGDGLYSFRWGSYRNIFLVTDEGVIATDPMSVDAAKVYRAEIAKITDKPVKYLV
jgi:hypothetical protein